MPAQGPGALLPLPVGGVIEEVIYSTLGNQAALIVKHWYVGVSNGTGQTLGNVAEQFDAQHGPDLKALMSGKATYYGTLVRALAPPPMSVPAWANALTGIGNMGGDALATQTCGLISFQTAKAGRKYRGRTFVPFPSETDNGDPPQPSAGYRGLLSTFASNFIGPILVGNAPNDVTLHPIILHRKDMTWDEVIAFKIRLFWATQRRRGFLGRPNTPPF